MAGAAALPLASALGRADDASPAASRLDALEAEFLELHAAAEATPDDDAADALCTRAHAIERLILAARATSASALRVKLRMMVRWADHSAPELKAGLREVLAHLGGTPVPRSPSR